MIDKLRVELARLLKDLDDIAAFGGGENGGVSRPAYSPEMTNALTWLASRMQDAGMRTRIDPAGNLIGRIGCPDAQAVVCGSHIDSVPNGGRLDGTLGVIAGLECARVLNGRKLLEDRALEVIAFADEEGAYFSLLGSNAMMGNVSIEHIRDARGRDGRLLREAMADSKLQLEGVEFAKRDPASIIAYIELHIEQGPVLEAEGYSIGIVNAINGIDATEYRLSGQARHAGTTPMAARKDAGRAAAEAMASAFAQFSSTAADGDRITFGSLEFKPGARNVVPATATVVSEVRSISQGGLIRLREQIDRAIHEACDMNGVTFSKRPLDSDEPATMAADLMALVESSCRTLNYSFKVIPSGAGHDAQAFAPHVPTAMIFIPSCDGISHNPAEHSTSEQIEAGANVLLHTLVGALFSKKSLVDVRRDNLTEAWPC